MLILFGKFMKEINSFETLVRGEDNARTAPKTAPDLPDAGYQATEQPA